MSLLRSKRRGVEMKPGESGRDNNGVRSTGRKKEEALEVEGAKEEIPGEKYGEQGNANELEHLRRGIYAIGREPLN